MSHGERLQKGFHVAVGLGVIATIVIFLWVSWVKVIEPHLGAITTGLIGLIGLLLVIYLLGYMVTDLPDDIRRWTQ